MVRQSSIVTFSAMHPQLLKPQQAVGSAPGTWARLHTERMADESRRETKNAIEHMTMIAIAPLAVLPSSGTRRSFISSQLYHARNGQERYAILQSPAFVLLLNFVSSASTPDLLQHRQPSRPCSQGRSHRRERGWARVRWIPSSRARRSAGWRRGAHAAGLVRGHRVQRAAATERWKQQRISA